LRGAACRFLSDVRVRQWSARNRDHLLGVIAWHASSTYADELWIAAAHENEDAVVYNLLCHACRHLPTSRPLALEYPAERACTGIQAAGFHLHQTLIWMSIPI